MISGHFVAASRCMCECITRLLPDRVLCVINRCLVRHGCECQNYFMTLTVIQLKHTCCQSCCCSKQRLSVNEICSQIILVTYFEYTEKCHRFLQIHIFLSDLIYNSEECSRWFFFCCFFRRMLDVWALGLCELWGLSVCFLNATLSSCRIINFKIKELHSWDQFLHISRASEAH